MQEEVNKKTVNLAIQTGKLSAKTLYKICLWYLRHEKQKFTQRKLKASEPKKGKQTVKELIGQGQGVSSVDLADTGLRDFQKIAKKYGVDFAVVKDKAGENPRYTIFFKAKDADAISKVMAEYASKQVKKEKQAEKPSLLKRLAHFKDVVKKTPHKEHEKRKEQER